MKTIGIIVAAIVGFVVAPTPAAAYVQQPVAPSALTLVSHADVAQRWDDRGDRRYDRGRRYGRDRHDRRWRWRTACRTEWRNGRRDRVCRKIRYRR